MRAKLQQLREANGYTQQTFSAAVGTSRSHYSQIETGDKQPALRLALRIKRVLNYYGDDIFDNTMPGLLELDLEQRIYLAGMITLNNGEIGLAQAKSPEDAEKVRESFQARIDYMAGDEEEPGGAFYPGPIQLWTNSAQVVVRGNYVLMVVADDGDEIVSRFDALFEQET